ncbi:MAG: GAF domain-containing sensor histidine kinase [Acidimicrobiia bacterium]|nr:GAF domain-containing sensor histidine kinase [Acidimicrobiia bacterium]
MDRTTVRNPAAKGPHVPGGPNAGLSPQAAVAELGQAALGGMAMENVLDLAVMLACEALNVEYAMILHQPAHGARLVVAAAHGWGDSIEIGATDVSCQPDSLAGYTLAAGNPVIVGDLASDQRFTHPARFADHQIKSGISVVIPDLNRPYGVMGVHTHQLRQFTLEEGDFLRSIAHVIGGTVQNRRSRASIERQADVQDRRLRYQAALAECAQTLLGNTGEQRLDEAVKALLTATQASYVLVERNHIDPELGLCSKTVAEIEKDGAPRSQLRNAYWDLVPWEKMPISRAKLEAGQPFVVVPDELVGIEREHYAADPNPVMSELNIPIFVDGKWEGLIGFSESTIVREWTDEDVSLLTTAAAMIGAFWEREAARESREQLIRAKDEFLASISHELRTPLTAVVGFGEILRDAGHTLSETDRREFLELLVAQGSDVTNIVNDLLVAAKADIGTLNVARVPVNLRAQTVQVLEAFNRDQLARIGQFEANDVRAIGDPDRIRQIVRNLVTNALRYGGDTLHIELFDRDETGIMVCDNGAAIPEEDRERIFQPYQRAHNAPGIVGSLGLGLSISRKLARMMNGDLVYRFENDLSIFELILPKTT